MNKQNIKPYHFYNTRAKAILKMPKIVTTQEILK